MRLISYVAFTAVTAMLLACGNGGADETVEADPDPEVGGAGNGGGGGGGEPSGWDGELAPAAQIASGEATLLGATQDGWAIFRSTEMLLAAPMTGDGAVVEVTPAPGSVLIKGNVVFNWASVDWELGVGELSVWTAEGGTHEVGTTAYAENLVAASASGKTLVYTANATETTTDLMITSNDFAAPEVLIPAMGLGSEETCGASIGFVGERLFVGWCAEGSRDARIERFEWSGEAWESTLIAEEALPQWSADETGERVFYQSNQYSAFVVEDGDATAIDASVSRGQMTPDGGSVFYTVGDQLRRSSYPDVNPTPIVTTGYKQPVGFSSDFEIALYSTTISYESGTRQDLLMATTDQLNSTPIELVGEPVAALGRSNMTRDGQFIFYLTDMVATGATLNIVARDGSEVLSLPNVKEVVAAAKSTLVFSDNGSDPEQYPVVADLKVINLEQETEPRVVEEKILDGRNFHVNATGDQVIYVRSGVDLDAEDPASKGLFAREIR